MTMMMLTPREKWIIGWMARSWVRGDETGMGSVLVSTEK